MIDRLKHNAVPLVLLTTVLTWYYFPALVLDHTFFFRDVMKFAVPEKWFQLHTFAQGAAPYWNPAIFSGVPFMALLHPNAMYPLNVLLFLGDFPYGYNLFVIAHHAILVFSVYALMRFWGVSPMAATASALVAALGGYFLSIVSLGNQLVSTVWMPLVLLSVQKYLKENHWGWLTAAVAFIVMQILGGSPESCVMSTLTVWLAAVFVTPGESTQWKRPILAVAGASVTAIVLTAFQLLPTYRVIQRSIRAWDLGTEFNTKWSLEPEALFQLMFPRDFDGFMTDVVVTEVPYLPSVYMGIVPAMALVTAGVLLQRREALFWTGVFTAGLLLALGGNNPVYTALLPFNPLLKMFRYPEKFFFLCAFAMTFLTGFMVDRLFDARTRRGLFPFTLACLLFGALLGAFAVFAEGEEVIPSLGVFGVAVVLGIAFLSGKANRELTGGLMVLVIFCDLWAAHQKLVPFIEETIYTHPPEVVQKLPRGEMPYRVFTGALDRDRFRSKNMFPETPNFLLSHILEKEIANPNLGTIFGLEYADGLMAIELESAWLWAQMFKRSPPDKRKRMLKRSNVRYWITDEDEGLVSSSPLSVFPPKKVKKFTDALPRAFLVAAMRRGPPVKLLNTYFSEDFDPRREVLLDEPIEFEPSDGFEGAVRSIEYAPNEVTVRTRQTGKGFLVLLDSYFPGWTVRVDGQAAPILRANHFFRAVLLDSGEHTLHFRYVPEGLEMGRVVSLFGLLALVAALATRFFRRNRTRARNSAGPPPGSTP